jgi:hypothetical protein
MPAGYNLNCTAVEIGAFGVRADGIPLETADHTLLDEKKLELRVEHFAAIGD